MEDALAKKKQLLEAAEKKGRDNFQRLFLIQSQQQEERDQQKTSLQRGQEAGEGGQNGVTKDIAADTDPTDLSGMASDESDERSVRESLPAAKRPRRSNENELPSATETPGPSPSSSSRLPSSQTKKGKGQKQPAFPRWQPKTIFLVQLLNTLQLKCQSTEDRKVCYLDAIKTVRDKVKSITECIGLNTNWLTTPSIQSCLFSCFDQSIRTS